MNNSTIGIKVADGSFYPILGKEASQRKKLVLTTVKDGQTNVQIDLYEGEGSEIDSERYIGSLLIENLAPGTAGESEIELLVGVDTDGTVAAEAKDLSSGESQTLSVSLASLTDGGVYDMPDFELGDEFEPWSGEDFGEFSEEEISVEEPDAPPAEAEDFSSEPDPGFAYAEPRRRKPLLLALFIVFGIAAVAALAILLYKIFEGPTIPPLEARRPAVEVAANGQTSDVSGQESSTGENETPTAGETSGAEEPAPSNSEGVAGARDGPIAAADSAQNAAQTGPELIGGVWYWIRWGDTLWDISSSFYRNPWQYGKIAEKNSIRNPDLIYAGTKIYIPEK